MPRDLILGTAGHIDHGKTALVKALTGIDCDRLPEEKKRGITIDIGFAHLDLGEFRLGIVDVPGHERFIKNMLAGATGIDLALLVVAADDSVMPQTREHLEILQLLGLRNGVIALTKCDLVDETTREVVELEVRDLVQGSFLEHAPIVRTSAFTGEGISKIKEALAEICRRVEARSDDEWFRLAIDRAFVVQGHGTVVTGSVTSGRVRVGDELEWQPRGECVRVRSLQNHGRPVDEVHRGQRSAINLAGVRHEDVVRGQELATPGYLMPSRVLTVRLHCLSDVKRPLKHRAAVRLHLGTAEIMATVSLLDCDRIQPGGWALAQLFLEESAVTVWGQPLVVREVDATHTLGGGQVLQPVARKIRRRHLEVIVRIERLWNPDVEQQALAVAWLAGVKGVGLADVVRNGGVGPRHASALLAKLRAEGELVALGIGTGQAETLLHKDVIRGVEERLLSALAQMHARSPLLPTQDRQKVQAQLADVANPALVDLAVERLLQEGRLVGDRHRIARSDFAPKLGSNLLKLKDEIVEAYRNAGLRPPRPKDFADRAGGNAARLDELFAICLSEGHLVHVKEDIYLHRDAEAQLRHLVTTKLAGSKGMFASEMREFLGAGRRFTIIFCEYLDRIGITRREGELRVLATNPSPTSPGPVANSQALAGKTSCASSVSECDCTVVHGELRVDLAARRVFVRETEVQLTVFEYRLLTTLIQHAGKVLLYPLLLKEVWGPAHAEGTQDLRVLMTSLRSKIEADPERPRYLRSEQRIGYRFAVQ
jgi:selenocysteine-specific elongation factor